MNMRTLLAGFAMTGLMTCSALAQDIRLAESAPLNIGMSFTLQSERLAEPRRIHVALPAGYENSATRYPVVYILDAQNFSLFQYAYGEASALAALNALPEVIVVGVVSEDRARDMTVASPTNQGRADAFIEFFRQELIGFIDAQFRTEPYTILIGHSLGAAFALHTLFQQPDTFDAYIALSPALWFDDGKIFHELKARLDSGMAFNNSLFTSLADEDGVMQQYYADLLAVLEEKKPPGLEFTQMSFPGETHDSTTLPGMHHGLLSMYTRWEPQDDFASFAELKAYYAALSEHYGYPVAISRYEASDLGLDLFDAGNAAAALEVFEYSLANLAQGPVEYHQMGLALRELGRLDEALAAFEQAVAKGEGLVFYQMLVDDRDALAQRLKQ